MLLHNITTMVINYCYHTCKWSFLLEKPLPSPESRPAHSSHVLNGDFSETLWLTNFTLTCRWGLLQAQPLNLSLHLPTFLFLPLLLFCFYFPADCLFPEHLHLEVLDETGPHHCTGPRQAQDRNFQHKNSQNGSEDFVRKGPVPVQTTNLTVPKGKGTGWDAATSPIYLPGGPGTPKRQRRLECCQTHQVTSFLWTETQRGTVMKESTG